MSYCPLLLNHNIVEKSETSKVPLTEVLRRINYNSGNSYGAVSIMKHTGLTSLNGVDNLFHPLTKISSQEVNEKFSHVFLFLQDHLRFEFRNSPWESIRRYLEEIKIPLVVFGLGANAVRDTPKELIGKLSHEILSFVRFLGDRAESIGVRGEYTADTLDEIGVTNYEIVGCPSYYEAGPNRLIRSPQYHFESSIAGNGLFSNSHWNIDYFLQDETSFIEALQSKADNIDGAINSLQTDYPHFKECFTRAYKKKKIHWFASINDWKMALKNRSFMLSAGTRVHGSILSANVGLPPLCTNGDQRATEMCKLFSLAHYPGYSLYDFTPLQLCEMADPSSANRSYPGLYKTFRDWLSRIGISHEFREV